MAISRERVAETRQQSERKFPVRIDARLLEGIDTSKLTAKQIARLAIQTGMSYEALLRLLTNSV